MKLRGLNNTAAPTLTRLLNNSIIDGKRIFSAFSKSQISTNSSIKI